MNIHTEAPSTLGDYFSVLRRRWVYLALITPSVILLAVFLAFAWPAKFQSSATIMLEPSSIPATLIQTSVISAADQQIELIRQRVMTIDSLQSLVAKVDPAPNDRDRTPAEKAADISDATDIQRVDPVTLQPIPVSSAFTISYLNANPRLAAQMCQELANLFLEYNRKTRTEAATDTYRFLNDKASQLDKQIRQIEGRIAEFKSQHADAMPEQKVRNQQDLEQKLRDADNLAAEIRLDEQKESLLQLQLDSTSSTLVGAASDWRTELAKMRANLADAKLRYTPNHPTIKQLEHAITELAAKHAVPDEKGVKPDNPEYMQIKSQLDSVRADKSALQSNFNRTQAQIADLRQRLEQSPAVERQFAEVDRDRQIAVQQYDAIQDKLRQADIAQQLESEGGGEKFTLIRAPVATKLPASPNRIGIILLGIVLGLGLGVGVAAIVDSSDATVRGSRDLRGLTKLPTIGAVPYILNGVERRQRRVRLLTVSAVFAVAFLIVVGTVIRSIAVERAVVTTASAAGK